MRTTDKPMKMVAARKAGVGMEEKSSSLPSQRRSCPSWRRRHDFHSPKYPVPLEDSVSPSHLLCMGERSDQIEIKHCLSQQMRKKDFKVDGTTTDNNHSQSHGS